MYKNKICAKAQQKQKGRLWDSCFCVLTECRPGQGSVQAEEFTVAGGKKAHHLKFVIRSGYDHFVAVHSVKVDGKAVHGWTEEKMMLMHLQSQGQNIW